VSTDAPTEPMVPAVAASTTAQTPVLPPAAPPYNRTRPVIVGGILGLIVGLGFGYDHFKQQPAEYESTARVKVVNGDPTAEAAIVRSPAVLDRAARRLDEQKPFAVPPPAPVADRAAYLAAHLGTTTDDALVLTFRGPNAADTPRYLRAVVEAYRAEVAARPAPTAAPAPAGAPPTSPVASPQPADAAKVEAERQRLTRELRAITTEDAAAVQTRLAANRAALDQLRAKQRDAERDLARIEAAGPARPDRLAVMKALGVQPEQPAPAAPVESPAPEETLLALQLKKAELGRRLGPEHRDMVALDEQMQFLKERIAKRNPPVSRPDELDRHRTALEADRTARAAEIGVLAATVEKDDQTLRAAAPIRAALDRLVAAGGPAPEQPKAPAPAPAVAPAATPVAATTVDVIAPPAEGTRISPLLYKSLVPGAATGLLGGLGIGLLVSVIGAAWAGRTPTTRRPARPRPAVRPAPARAVPKDDGPALGVPVLGRIPDLRTDLPPEKKSADGLAPALVCFHRPNGPEAEAFRAARRELATALQNRGHQVIPVTSPGAGDGKSTVAANLAISLAQSGKRVILLDCDLRSTKMQDLFRLTRLGDGLKSVMNADADLRMAVRSCEVGNLFLLPAGRGPMDPLDILTRPKFRELIADLRASYEYVILDAPPALAEQEFATLAGLSDGAVLVVRGGADAPARTTRAKNQVVAAGTKVLGAITNAAPARPDADQPPAAAPPPEPSVTLSDTKPG
jgi:capsular exopolysaccharide synthesis family protein